SWKYKLNPPKEAAVLLPLCTVDGIASILFTVRSSKLRTHTGEVSFPGGNTDPEDENPTVTALRETHEEILIHPTNVNVLGPFISLPNKSLSTKVTAVIGDLGIISPSLLKFNTDEVESIFTVPIDQLL
ncbi:NUDIX hydrolase domain-like protein, partial [Globomyces pollinis-pini]